MLGILWDWLVIVWAEFLEPSRHSCQGMRMKCALAEQAAGYTQTPFPPPCSRPFGYRGFPLLLSTHSALFLSCHCHCHLQPLWLSFLFPLIVHSLDWTGCFQLPQCQVAPLPPRQITPTPAHHLPRRLGWHICSLWRHRPGVSCAEKPAAHLPPPSPPQAVQSGESSQQ